LNPYSFAIKIESYEKLEDSTAKPKSKPNSWVRKSIP
jgi:hypothetical protein